LADVAEEVAKAGERAVRMSRDRGGSLLDYSEGSLAVVEEILSEAAGYASEMSAGEVRKLTEDFGCYVLEVARRTYGGTYRWAEDRDAPVLITGEPVFHVAILAWDKVRGRLAGDEGDNIPFFYQGYSERARRARPGDRVIFV
jgi:hypothetical protein